MLPYLLRRLLGAVPLLIAVLTLTFIALRLVPGDPLDRLADNPRATPAMIQRERLRLGLDRPLPVQYLRFLKAYATGDLGTSFSGRRPVAQMIAEALPVTLLIGGLALIVELSVGIALGLLGALNRGRPLDTALGVGTLAVHAMPSFWLALMLILLLAIRLPLFPPSHLHAIGAENWSAGRRLLDLGWHLILPVAVLGLGSAAATARLVRTSLLEQLGQDYLRTARAKGLSERQAVVRHGLRNALLPVVTLIGLSVPAVVSGAVIVETIFSLPGMGRLAVTALFARDYPVVLATTAVAGATVVLGNLLADIGYALVDPRIRLTGRR